MNQQTSEALRIFFRRVTGIYPELFNTAHVICGNYDLAEYVVRNAILTTWQQNVHGGMGFNEMLRSTNGGNPHPMDGWDDAYENFMVSLEEYSLSLSNAKKSGIRKPAKAPGTAYFYACFKKDSLYCT